MPTRQLLAVPTTVLALTLAACGGATTTSPGATSPASSTPAASSLAASPGQTTPAPAEGGYVSLADYRADQARYDQGKVVLFFAATWCPTCQRADKNLKASGVPAGLTVVKADYDDERELKKTYGVTVQHTFVQVDAAGKQLAKFSGQDTAEAILAKTV